MKFPDRLQSRKLWVTLIAALVTALNAMFEWGMSDAQILALASTVAAYLVAQGAVDYKASQKEPPQDVVVDTSPVKDVVYDPKKSIAENIMAGQRAYSEATNAITVSYKDPMDRHQKLTELAVKYSWLFKLYEAKLPKS